MNQKKLILGSELQKQLISAMEDQERQFRLNLEARLVEPGRPNVGEGLLPLPRWTSVDGFRMISDFIRTLPNPLLRAELQEILDKGHGVFRNFKITLRTQPLAYRNWQRYRRRTMEGFLLEWASNWEKYLEILPLEEEPEELDDLVKTEFSFQSRERVPIEKEALTGLQNSDLTWLPPLDDRCLGMQTEVLTMEGDPVGWIWACDAPGAESAQVLVWYVREDFRGLGLGRTLLHQMEAALKAKSYKRVILPDYGTERGLSRLVTREGYLHHARIFNKELV